MSLAPNGWERDAVEDFVTILGPLLAVIVVIAGAYATSKWIAGRRGGFSYGRHIQVLERAALAKDAWLMLVRVGGRTYLASAASGKVELIREMDEQELKRGDTPRPGTDFLSMFTKSMGRGKQPPEDSGREQDGTQP